MIKNKLDLIGEQTSPLFRIMWIYNISEPARRNFNNNICAFHIGNGLILSVAHNIKTESQVLITIDDPIYQTEIAPRLNKDQGELFDRCYNVDPANQKRHWNLNNNEAGLKSVIEAFKQINFDTRWLSLTKRNFCNPYLIIQFKNNQFYNDQVLTGHFNGNTYFHEPSLNRHTFLIQVELVDAYYNEDFALYRLVNTHQSIIDRLPSITPDYTILDDNQSNLYCVQSSIDGDLGRLANKATIDGYIDHHGTFNDRIGGNYTFEGMRYLIKGYFRFGSSGAPYVFYDADAGMYKANAIQSEACPIQLSINNNRDGNFQYVNAVASPLNIIRDRLQNHLLA